MLSRDFVSIPVLIIISIVVFIVIQLPQGLHVYNAGSVNLGGLTEMIKVADNKDIPMAWTNHFIFSILFGSKIY